MDKFCSKETITPKDNDSFNQIKTIFKQYESLYNF